MKRKLTKEEFEKERAEYLKMKNSSVYFVWKMFKKKPQMVKPEYKYQLEYILSLEWEKWEEAKKLITAEWFGDYDAATRSWKWYSFDLEKNYSWQQFLILTSADKAVTGKAAMKISVVSGHGIGKSSCISWIIIWFLFTRPNSQAPCTAPTATQMHDVLWKELSKWINKLPEGIKQKFEWQSDYIRITENRNEWFARAKTSSKENSEALAGVHANDVLTIADEASGVEEAIFNTASGAWTSGNILVILISNGTRNEGFFYKTHQKDDIGKTWANLSFSSIESPLVDPLYEGEQAELHGRESDQYTIRVKGGFPKKDNMDDTGYIPLLVDSQINEYPLDPDEIKWKGTSILGVDPSGEGEDKTVFVLRDSQKAQKIYEEATSNAKGIAARIIWLIDEYNLDPANVVVDSFGVGSDVGKEVALGSEGKYNITTLNVGDKCDYEFDQEIYLNKRAFMYHDSGLRGWIKGGGMIVPSEGFKKELLTVKFKRSVSGVIQIMPKLLMRKLGIKSPNIADALALTFLRDIQEHDREIQELIEKEHELEDFDPFSVV